MANYTVVIRGTCTYAETYDVDADTIEEAVSEVQGGSIDLESREIDSHHSESIEVYDEDGKRVLDKIMPREGYL